MVRSKGPALYELFNQRKSGPAADAPAPVDAADAQPVRSSSILLVLGAISVTVVLIAVLVRALGGGAKEPDTAPPPLPTLDPAAPALTAPQAPEGPSEPRSGWTYLQLATVQPAESGRLIDFCAAEGLAVIAVPVNNGRFHQILALPGLAQSSMRNGTEGRAVADKVEAVGAKWKRASRGNSDFHDAFWITK